MAAIYVNRMTRSQKDYYRPEHHLIHNWIFEFETDDQEEAAKREAYLADSIAEVCDLNGLTANDIMHIFPLVLRMLKSKSAWAQ